VLIDLALASIPQSERKNATTSVPNPFQIDLIRMIAILFGPMLVGAIVIPLLMVIFSLMGYEV
jgi:hypothetical protein